MEVDAAEGGASSQEPVQAVTVAPWQVTASAATGVEGAVKKQWLGATGVPWVPPAEPRGYPPEMWERLRPLWYYSTLADVTRDNTPRPYMYSLGGCLRGMVGAYKEPIQNLHVSINLKSGHPGRVCVLFILGWYPTEPLSKVRERERRGKRLRG